MLFLQEVSVLKVTQTVVYVQLQIEAIDNVKGGYSILSVLTQPWSN